MANTELVNLILTTTAEAMTYLLPIIAIMTGITFIFSFLFAVTIGAGKRTFGR